MRGKRNLDLRLLSYFHRTALTGNITKAALELNIAQPTLSKALKLLEHQVEAQLFERRTDGVHLTPIGARLMQHAGAVIAQVNDAEREIHEISTGMRAEVRLGVGPAWIRRLLPRAIAAVRSARPDIMFHVYSGFDQALLKQLEQGELDFVVAEKPLGEDSKDLLFKPLTHDELVVVGRRDHPSNTKDGLSVQKLLEFDWALPLPHTLARRKLDGKVLSLGYSPILPVITSGSLSFLMQSAHLSDLLLYTTRSHLLTPEAQDLTEIQAPDLVTERDAGLIFRKPGLVTPAAQFVIDALEKVCVEDPVN